MVERLAHAGVEKVSDHGLVPKKCFEFPENIRRKSEEKF
jgi:hypothetical protein